MNLRDVTGRVLVECDGPVDPVHFELRPDSQDGTVVEEVFHENVYQLDPAEVWGKIVVDLGANIGAFTLWCWRAGAAIVHAYEPGPDNMVAFRHNVALNPVPGAVHPYEAAVLGDPGIVDIVDVGAGTRISDSEVPAAGSTRVPASTLDAVIAAAPGQVGVLKLDVEGSEYAVFAAATPATLDRVDRIVMEWHTFAEEAPRIGRLAEQLCEWGKVTIEGKASTGGYLFGRRYGA